MCIRARKRWVEPRWFCHKFAMNFIMFQLTTTLSVRKMWFGFLHWGQSLLSCRRRAFWTHQVRATQTDLPWEHKSKECCNAQDIPEPTFTKFACSSTQSGHSVSPRIALLGWFQHKYSIPEIKFVDNNHTATITGIKQCSAAIFNSIFWVIRSAASVCILSLKTTSELCSCFFHVRSHPHCVSTAPELGRESRKNDCEFNALVGRILTGSSNINTAWRKAFGKSDQDSYYWKSASNIILRSKLGWVHSPTKKLDLTWVSSNWLSQGLWPENSSDGWGRQVMWCWCSMRHLKSARLASRITPSQTTTYSNQLRKYEVWMQETGDSVK